MAFEQRRMELVKGTVDANRAFAHTKYWVEEIGNRLDGTPGQKLAADYAKRFWEQEQIPCQVLELDGFVSIPGRGQVILEGKTSSLHCSVYAQSSPTGPEGLEGGLVYVGAGEKKDVAMLDLTGKIALSDRRGEITITQQALNCAEKGAAAMICANWGTGDQNYIHCCTVKDQWGNPAPEDAWQVPVPIPVISVGHGDGLLLKKDEEAGKKVKISAQVESGWKTIYLPFARIDGHGPDRNQFVLLGTHYDCWNRGATCNGVGDGSVLELSRALKQMEGELNRSVWICLWPAHETGTMVGSTYFVDHYWQELTERCVAYINIDQPGMWLTSRWVAAASEELKEFHTIIDEAMTDIPKEHITLKKTGDQSFFGIGIPSIYARNFHSQELIDQWGGATLGFWNHNEYDTLDKIDVEQLQTCLEINLAYLLELSACRLLPMDFTGILEDVEVQLKRLAQLSVDGLEREIKLAGEAAGLWKDFQVRFGKEETAEIYNSVVLWMSRELMPMICSVSGKFGQDDYGLPELSQFMPGITSLWNELAAMEKGGDAYKWNYTRAYREKNKVWEVLNRLCGRLRLQMKLYIK